MGSKNNPGKFDCYEAADPDEPMFVLLGRDPLAPILVEAWASMREHLAGNPSKVSEARACAEWMRRWRQGETLVRGRPTPPSAAGERGGG